MQIKEALKMSRDFLVGHENAILDAELIVAHVLGESREYLLAHDDEEIDDSLLDLLKGYLQRVKDGEPLAYILNEKEFYGLNLFVDRRVLVPRPETEQIVERVMEYIESQGGEKNLRILDVGTGSGNMAVAIGRNLNVAEVLALDIDEGALDVARTNVEQFSLEEKIELAQSDLLDAVDDGEYFDVIVANLPYIGRVDHRHVSVAAEKYEPDHALFGGDSGLELYKKMFQQMLDKGVGFDLLMGEFGFGQREDMEEMLNKYFEQKWRIEKDLAGIDRIFVVNNN